MNFEQSKLIYTLGTSTRSITEFLELLTRYSVKVLVDVRRFPSSRFEHFRSANLSSLLSNAGIEYVYMGEEMGGYRQGGYQNFTTTPDFQVGLDNLEKIAREKNAVIVCAERFPWRCHRRFIALELEKRGWQVVHIIDGERVWVPGKR